MITFVSGLLLLLLWSISDWPRLGALSLLPIGVVTTLLIASWGSFQNGRKLKRFTWVLIVSAVAVAISGFIFGLCFPNSEKLWKAISEIPAPLVICLIFANLERRKFSSELTEARKAI